MKAVIQRVKRASATAGDRSASIGPGLLVLAGLETGDGEALFDLFVACLRAEGCPVETGFFQEMMEVELVNDGPATFILER
jgi:D-Tyr-tRNAtyr deacylase